MLSASRRHSTSHTKLRLSDIETEDFMVNTCVHCALFGIEQKIISGYFEPRYFGWLSRRHESNNKLARAATGHKSTTMEDLAGFRRTWQGLAWLVVAAVTSYAVTVRQLETPTRLVAPLSVCCEQFGEPCSIALRIITIAIIHQNVRCLRFRCELGDTRRPALQFLFWV
jgi:hypothetical protein